MESKKRLSVINGALLLVNTMFGAGIIALPGSFLQLGYIPATIILIVTAIFTFISLIFLAYAAEVSQNFSYSKLCKEVGKPLSIMLDLSIVVLCYGCTICYALTLVTTARNVVPSLVNNQTLQDAIIAFIILAPLFFLSRLRSLDKLSFVSVVTFGAVVCVLFEFLYYKFYEKYKTNYAPAPAFNNGYAQGLAVLFFSFGCQQNAVSIYSELRNRRMSTAVKVMGLGCILGSAVYFLLGYLGSNLLGRFDVEYVYFLDVFQGKKESSFLKFVKNSTWDKMGILPRIPVYAFLIVLFTGFPIQTFAARNSLFNLISDKSMNNRNIFVVTLLQFAIIYCFILAETESQAVMDYIGTIVCPLIAFIFPSIIYMKFVGWKKASFYLAAFILLVTANASIYSFYSLVTKNKVRNISETNVK